MKPSLRDNYSFMKPQGTLTCEAIVIREGDALRDIPETFILNVNAAQPLPRGVPSTFSLLSDWPIEL
jgi:hypothetical protein